MGNVPAIPVEECRTALQQAIELFVNGGLAAVEEDPTRATRYLKAGARYLKHTCSPYSAPLHTLARFPVQRFHDIRQVLLRLDLPAAPSKGKERVETAVDIACEEEMSAESWTHTSSPLHSSASAEAEDEASLELLLQLFLVDGLPAVKANTSAATELLCKAIGCLPSEAQGLASSLQALASRPVMHFAEIRDILVTVSQGQSSSSSSSMMSSRRPSTLVVPVASREALTQAQELFLQGGLEAVAADPEGATKLLKAAGKHVHQHHMTFAAPLQIMGKYPVKRFTDISMLLSRLPGAPMPEHDDTAMPNGSWSSDHTSLHDLRRLHCLPSSPVEWGTGRPLTSV